MTKSISYQWKYLWPREDNLLCHQSFSYVKPNSKTPAIKVLRFKIKIYCKYHYNMRYHFIKISFHGQFFKTLPEIIFGLLISTNPSSVRASRKYFMIPPSTLNIAWFVAVLRSRTLLSSLMSWPTEARPWQNGKKICVKGVTRHKESKQTEIVLFWLFLVSPTMKQSCSR